MPPSLALRGSTKSIVEFFEHALVSILYQRGVYPAEDFIPLRRYGLQLLKPQDDELKIYLRKILKQVHRWMISNKCSRLLLCIVDLDTGDTVEQWAFDVEMANSEEQSKEKEEEELEPQIRSLIRQITASVTFLPQLDEDHCHSFNVLCYTAANANVPPDWADAPAANRTVKGQSETVVFRNFNTGEHVIGAQVTYSYNQ